MQVIDIVRFFYANALTHQTMRTMLKQRISLVPIRGAAPRNAIAAISMRTPSNRGRRRHFGQLRACIFAFREEYSFSVNSPFNMG
jgi:hypothetical protein